MDPLSSRESDIQQLPSIARPLFRISKKARHVRNSRKACHLERLQHSTKVPGGSHPNPRSLTESAETSIFLSRFAAGSITTTNGDARFQYRDIQGTEFRLIRLLPESMSIIKCEVVPACLKSHPKYVAVSYAWGDIDDTVKIQVDGYPFTVTSSLHGVLNAIRKKDEAVLLWADALCINQNNKEEQSQQVQLMTSIYGQAESVVVWLGPEAENSRLAVELLQEVAKVAKQPEAMDNLIANSYWRDHFTALVNLFERDYWRRLWVVQEVLKAQSVRVYCGETSLPWKAYTDASEAFDCHLDQLERYFPSGFSVSQQQQYYTTVLTSLGPVSIHNLQIWKDAGTNSLLEVLRACRTKFASEPRDKVFGVLGILPEAVRHNFPTDYTASLKEVYINVVDFLLHTTRRLDVICEAIYFPIHISMANLPSWVPDWSHIPQTNALGLSYNFSASQDTCVKFKFPDPTRRSKLEISAINLGTVERRGIALGTLFGLDDSLMAFLHWHAILLEMQGSHDREYAIRTDKAFCRTLCLGQKTRWEAEEWVRVCYHVFSSLIRERLPYIQLDHELGLYADLDVGVLPDERRRVLHDNCASRMASRLFFVTDEGLIGMGTGFMDPGDIVCVPLGCSTPILLRPEANGEYRYVGDVYVDGYMHGKAVSALKHRIRTLEEYVIR
ncbi:heterokaryon incompatibility protein-domain-containing protein [Hypoxylon cercidicola]|nr:heterokaryon incompatibility protein-domain-containing protein [Hypoxylon cercidicola]